MTTQHLPLLVTTASPEIWGEPGPHPITLYERMAWWSLTAIFASLAVGAVTGVAVLWLHIVKAYGPILSSLLMRGCLLAFGS